MHICNKGVVECYFGVSFLLKQISAKKIREKSRFPSFTIKCVFAYVLPAAMWRAYCMHAILFLHNTRTTLLVYPQALANKSKWHFVIFVFDFSSSFKFCPAIVCCLVAGCLILPQNELVHGNGKRMASDQQNL